MTSFSNCLLWFGPFSDRNPMRFLTRIYEILRSKYFHGSISKTDAERILKFHKPGTYLVRYSSEPGHYTASFVLKENHIGHIRLGAGGKMVCENFPLFVAEMGPKYNLRSPCPDSQYANAFQDLDDKLQSQSRNSTDVYLQLSDSDELSLLQNRNPPPSTSVQPLASSSISSVLHEE